MEIDAFLADSVASAEGKLFIQGAGWNTITAGDLPARHDRIGIGVLVTVPYTETNIAHAFDIRLEDEDGNSVPFGDAPDPEGGTIDRLSSEFTMGRPPTIQPGDDQIFSLALNIDGLTLERAGAYRFVVSIDGEDCKRLRFRVVSAAG